MAISEKTHKTLWARSGNRCSMCKIELVLEKDQFNIQLNLGEECHIISKKENGPRHQKLENFDYDSSENLLLLCCNHHKMVDEKVIEYSVETLRKIKLDHENWVKTNLDLVSKNEISYEMTNLDKLINFVTTKHSKEMNSNLGNQIFESKAGLDIAYKEVEKIKNQINSIVSALSEKATNYKMIVRDNRFHICDILFKGHTFLAQFYQTYGYTASKSYLLFGILNGTFDSEGNADPFNPVTVIDIIRLDFSFDSNGNFGWRNQVNDNEFYFSENITVLWVNKYFEEVLK